MIYVCSQGWQYLLYDPVTVCHLLVGPSVPGWSPSEMTTWLVASEVPAEFSAQLEASCLTNSGFWVPRPLPTAPSPSPRATMPEAFVLSQQECDQEPTHSQSHPLARGWPPNTLHLSSSPAQHPPHPGVISSFVLRRTQVSSLKMPSAPGLGSEHRGCHLPQGLGIPTRVLPLCCAKY